MTLEQIKEAIDAGKKVFQHDHEHEVIKDNLGQYLIVYHPNGYTIGLTHQDGVTMNGKETEFFCPADSIQLGPRFDFLPVISIAHVTLKTAEIIANTDNSDELWTAICRFEGGFFIHFRNAEDDMPDDLKELKEWFEGYSFSEGDDSWLMVSGNGPVVSGLKTYFW
jgi:hypothetical protein